jgi:hypothetical protein
MPSPIHHALFPTTIGAVGVAWSERGLVALALPERDEAATEQRLIAKSHSIAKAEPPQPIADAFVRSPLFGRKLFADWSGRHFWTGLRDPAVSQLIGDWPA